MNEHTYYNATIFIAEDDSFYIFLDGSVYHDHNLIGISKTNCNVTITEHSVVVETTELTKTYKHENVIVLDKEDYSYFESVFVLGEIVKFRISEKHKKYQDMLEKYSKYGKEIYVEKGFIFKKYVKYFVLPKKKKQVTELDVKNYAKKIHNRNNLKFVIVFD